MTRNVNSMRLLLILSLLSTFAFSACQGGQITIDLPGGGGDGGGDTGGESAFSNQTLFILMIVLLVAMFAMVLVAMSSR